MYYTLVLGKLHEMFEVLGYGKALDVSRCDVLHINNREPESRLVLTYHVELYNNI
jgi:hypothetical protein